MRRYLALLAILLAGCAGTLPGKTGIHLVNVYEGGDSVEVHYDRCTQADVVEMFKPEVRARLVRAVYVYRAEARAQGAPAKLEGCAFRPVEADLPAELVAKAKTDRQAAAVVAHVLELYTFAFEDGDQVQLPAAAFVAPEKAEALRFRGKNGI